MLRIINKKIKKIVSSFSGQGTIILLITLIPLVLVIPLIAIDVNTYLLSKAQLQNSLDASAVAALTKSTDDSYRSEKILKIITTDGKSNNFVSNLCGELYGNFRPKDNIPSPQKINSNKYITMFTPGFNFTKDLATLTIEYTGTGRGSEYVSGDLTRAHSIDGGVSLTLETEVILPTMSKFSDFFGKSDIFKTKVVVKSGVTGIRILKSDTSDLLENHDEWGY